MILCRNIRQFKGEPPASGSLISVQAAHGFYIGERIEILTLSNRHVAFAVVVRDLSKDTKFHNIHPYVTPGSSQDLKPYNSAEGWWELRVE